VAGNVQWSTSGWDSSRPNQPGGDLRSLDEGHDYAFEGPATQCLADLASFASFHSIAGSGSGMPTRWRETNGRKRPLVLRAAPNGFASIRRVAISSVDKAMITSPCRWH